MSEPTNPYQAPEADLEQPVTDIGGSIENTLAGNADLEFAAVLTEAWAKTKGIKTIVDGGGILLYVGMAIITFVLTLIFSADSNTILGTLITQFVVWILVYPFLAGVFMVGLRQSVGLPVSFDMVFAHYGAAIPLVVIGVLQSVVTSVGFLLLFIPGLYLSFALSLAIPLHVDKQMGVTDSLKMSLKIVNQKFLTVAILALTAFVITTLSIITVIGWIWGIPWTLMVFAITYRQLAGTELTE